ncbi:MAG: hypothetical protein VB031_04115 [Eubacteriaceae bacterium]|nr:hypothetical protein [Eubacteriaceae bacterium]
MTMTNSEKEYMMAFKDKQYKPELLFDDKKIVDRIKTHPMAIWKCMDE